MSAAAVFISYASQDNELAERYCGELERSGVACWIAPRDVSAGQRYAEAILDAIEECDIFLLVFSEQANRSPHVSNEIEKAASKDKPIFLIRTDDTHPHDNREISLFLTSHQWFEASTTSPEEYLPRLTADVQRLVEHERDSAMSDQATTGPVLAPIIAERPIGSRAIGIDVGSSKILGWVEVLDETADSFDSARYTEAIRRPATARSVLEQVRGMLERLIADHFPDDLPTGVGIAVPGLVDVRAGTLKFSPGLGLRNVPFKTSLATVLPDVKIRIDNDTRCATRCELHLGVGKEFDDFACIFLGSGVGSGLVIDGKIHFGHNFSAGEIGHLKIESNGPPCTCGQIGCLETFVNGSAIVARARAKAIDYQSRDTETLLSSGEGALTPEMVAAAVEDGDLAAIEVMDEVADKLGVGVGNYLNLVNPSAVVLGGGLMTGFYLHIIDRLTRSMQTNALAEVAQTPIVQSQFTDHGAAIGAAMLFHPEDNWPY
jgi:predicted NBD/HSP70 family sugar kinase